VLAGLVAIVAGNLIRIAGSVVVGLFSGRASLVLFHDWVGSVFGIAYTIGGFIVTLTLLLRGGQPRRGRHATRRARPHRRVRLDG
jgi:carbamoyl-phosphate synthase large subunit